jgi:hypothetical protein
MRHYESVTPISRADAEVELAFGDTKRVCDALLRLTYHDPEWRWIQNQCVRFARHFDADVRGLAVTCFGHVARIHGALDLDVVSPVLRELRSDPEMGGRVSDTWDDIEVFLANK